MDTESYQKARIFTKRSWCERRAKDSGQEIRSRRQEAWKTRSAGAVSQNITGVRLMESLETKLAVHEAVCATRYEQISASLREGDRRMSKIEYLLYAVIIVVLFGPGVAAEFFKKLIGL